VGVESCSIFPLLELIADSNFILTLKQFITGVLYQ
jgi:hypothetical protein